MISLADFGRCGRTLKITCRRFLADESGTSLPLVAAVVIPVLGFIGLGTDAGRGYLIKARLGDALDAAVLAGAHVTDPADLQSEIQKYFNANFPPGYMGAKVTLDPLTLSGSEDEIINISASAEIDTTFMRLFGYQSLGIGTATEVTRQTCRAPPSMWSARWASAPTSWPPSLRPSRHQMGDLFW